MPSRPTGPGTETPTALPDSGGIDVLDSLIVRQPVEDPGAVRETVAAWVTDRTDGDVRTLLPVEGVTLVTLFLDAEGGCLGRGEPALVWYLEVVDDDAPRWREPARTIRESPLFDGALAGDVGEGTAHADGGDGLVLTHAVHPRRAELYAGSCGRSLVAPVAGDELPIPVAVLTLRFRPGVRSRLVWHAGRLVDRLKSIDAVGRRAREATDTIEAEAMYTESLLVERRPATAGHLLHYYMETESMEQLYEGFAESSEWTVRVAEWLFEAVLTPDSAERFFTTPLESDAEVLVHAVHPGRP